MADSDVVVIGAGPAGLAVSACLRERGIGSVVLERESTVGSAWRRHYDRLHLHTAKRFSSLPMAPWPTGGPAYPSRQQVVDYLAKYAEDHAIKPRFGVEVKRLSRQANGIALDTNEGPMAARCVVVATGYNGVATRPALPGLDLFAGSVVHARDYRNPAPYAGKRTLVMGCGNSGAEIALDLAEKGVETSMVVRGPVHVCPRDLFGRSTQQTGVMLSGLPTWLRDLIATTMMRLAVGDLSRWGIVRPDIGPTRMIEESGRIPMLDIGTVAMIKSGRIRVLPAAEQAFADSVRFAGGATHPFDAIILATGYSPGLDRLVDGFDAVAGTRGRPARFGDETAIPGLFFVGFKNPSTGALREISFEAPRAAAGVAARLAGRTKAAA